MWFNVCLFRSTKVVNQIDNIFPSSICSLTLLVLCLCWYLLTHCHKCGQFLSEKCGQHMRIMWCAWKRWIEQARDKVAIQSNRRQTRKEKENNRIDDETVVISSVFFFFYCDVVQITSKDATRKQINKSMLWKRI